MRNVLFKIFIYTAAIAQALARHRVRLVWIYLRAPQSPGLEAEPGSDEEAASTVPEVFLHRFFRSLPTPYTAYEAGSPEALQQAIADVERLENLPITTTDTVPRRDLSGICLALALGCALVLAWAAHKEMPAWAWRLVSFPLAGLLFAFTRAASPPKPSRS